jgi:hypothetical protein
MTSSFIDDLAAPPKQFHPFVRWWLPGLDVDKDELIKEIQELDAGGFGGAEVQSFLIGSPSPNEELKHRFAPHPFYYEAIAAILGEARQRGLTIDLTISSSWPPGGSWVTKSDSLHTLLMGSSLIHGPTHVEMKAPALQLNTFYKSGLARKITGDLCSGFNLDEFTLVAVVAAKPFGKSSTKLNFIRPKARPLIPSTAVDITPKGSDKNWISWDVPEGTWQVFSIYAGPSGMRPLSDARASPAAESLVVNVLDEQAVRRFVEGHVCPGIEQWKPFLGTTLRALFTDSQEIACEWYWTADFFEEFKNRRGYDVRPYLPACYAPNRDNQFTYVLFMNEKPCFEFLDGDGERIRHDWEETISDLFAERYCGGVSRVAKEYGLVHRIQTYGMRVDLLKAYGQADIPETEQLFAGGLLDFLKMAGDAALLYDKPIASCETLTAMQRDYMTTPLKMKVAADRLFVAGINQVIYHGFPYFAPWKQYPGHYPWSPPCHAENLNRNNPFTPFFSRINHYIARGQYLMRQGKTRCNIGVYYAILNYDHKMLKQEDFGAGFLDGFDGEPMKGIVAWFLTRSSNAIDKKTLQYQQLGDRLMARGYYYAHVNEDALLSGTMEDGILHVGAARFEVLIFPGIDKVTLLLAQKLQEFASQGLKVIFHGASPDGQPGFHEHEQNDPKIKAIINGLQSNFITLDEDKDVALYLWDDLQVHPCIEFVKPDPEIQCICKETAEGNLYFVRSTSKTPSTHVIKFRELAKEPSFIDLWTGKIEPVAQYQSATGKKAVVSLSSSTDKQTITLHLESYGSCMLLFSPSRQKELPIHVLEADVQLQRDGTKFKGLVQKEGTFRAKFSNGTERQVKLLLPPPPSIPLDVWSLEVKHRNVTGEIETISFDVVSPGDWRKNKRLKHCSGPGTYTYIFSPTTQHRMKDVRLKLKLGLVHDVAEIKVNGKDVAVLLVPPYDVDITDFVFDGENRIDVIVHGTLRNLLVGYAQKGKVGKPWKHHKHRQLMPVGLIGPATIEASNVITFEP